MKAVYLMMHRSKPNVCELTRQVVQAFHGAGISMACEPWLAERIGGEAQALFQGSADACAAVVSIGGDGTFLRANQLAAQLDLPLFGVNVGRIGFLAEVELHELPDACLRLQKGEYEMENRMMLEASCEGYESTLALNDIVVSRGGHARLITVKVWVDDVLAGRYHADGLIVSTPTGSTGYSLSAGGPIVHPGVDCMILSPICAHSLQHRPIVISAQQTVTLELDCEPYQQAHLSADGQDALSLSAKHMIAIKRSAKSAKLIRFHSLDFFSIIRQKLAQWSC